MQLRRTTIRLPQTIYRKAKIKAAREDRTLQELVIEALRANLSTSKSGKVKKGVCLQSYSLGKLKGKIDRQAIYEDLDLVK